MFFFCKFLLNGASHDNKIGCIRLVWAGARKYNFSFLLCVGSLSMVHIYWSFEPCFPFNRVTGHTAVIAAQGNAQVRKSCHQQPPPQLAKEIV